MPVRLRNGRVNRLEASSADKTRPARPYVVDGRADHLHEVVIEAGHVPFAAGKAGYEPLSLRAGQPVFFDGVVWSFGCSSESSNVPRRRRHTFTEDTEMGRIHILAVRAGNAIGYENVSRLYFDIVDFFFPKIAY